MKAKATPRPGRPFPIVGIGASAGGLQALESFLTILPKKFGFAVIFIQHLSPKHKNLMPELLRSRTTDLQIEEIEDGLEILPGRLYLCPPASEIRIQKSIFRIASHIHQHVHLPIDEFFASLAEDVAERAIAVILSGAGTDGARGVQAVRNAGGTVFVQDPATAEFPAMPLAAINTGQMDGVLSPRDIAREILKFQGSGIGTASPEAFAKRVQFEPFYRLIYEKTGYRFNHYKQSVVARRIKRRMSLLGASAVKDYLDMVADKDSEAALLASDLMIGVTSFFRDRLAWKALHLDVTRKLIARDDDSPIRVWTPACATGEEPYSIAMMLQQELDLAGKKREIQVFATDVNDRALERAREGMYPASIAADVPADYMKKFFTPSENGLFVTVNKEIRQHIVFAKHDLLTDPPFSRLDLVICRNLLIYLESDAQEKCISLFHYALKEGGSLFLGGAESPGRNSALFIPLPHKKCRVYRKGETERSVRTPLSVPYAAERSASSLPIKQTSTTEYRQSAIHLIQEALLEEHAPAAVAIDQHYEILYHNGPTSRYLRQPRGTPTQNLLELLPKNLRNRLRGGLYRAAQEGKPIAVRTSISGEDEQKRHVTFRVSKVRDDLFLIIFEEKGLFPEQKEATLLEAAAIEETAVHQLESELSATREDLQSHIEQLKSLNEELHSSNEELQAANEELETSREELQSLNEELITVNTQLQTKIEEEEETNNDLSNFLASANIPTVFLNPQFRVKRFTPAMSRLVTLIPGDVGRPIIDMSQEHLGPDLIADARSVLDDLTPIKRELAINGAWYVRTTLPYRTADNRIEGVVVTYVDISERKQAEENLRKATERERFLAHVLETAVVPFGIGAPDGSLILFNRAFAELTGYTKEEIEKKDLTWASDLTPPEWREREAAILDEARRTGQPVRYEKEYLRKNGSRVPIELSVEPVFDDAGNLKHYYSFLTDITERKRAEAALHESEHRVRLKLESILSPEGDIGSLELADIIDAPAIQLLMDDFYQLARIPMAIVDLKGKLLVGTGWQDICTKFHRVHPDTCKHCIESDTLLSAGIPPGESRLYKCKNNMWDIATPIMMGSRHVGNIFSGQFFFEGELLDYEFFRLQAKQYGFDEEEYIAALEAVPRLSKESVATGMAFFMKLAHTLSQLSYSNIKLARSLAQTDALMEALRESEERFRALFENAADAIIVTDPEGGGRVLSVNPSACRMFGYTEEEFLQIDRQTMFDTSDPALAALLEAREITGRAVSSLPYKRKDDSRFTGDLSTAMFYDKTGNRRSVAVIRDVTERKRAEETMRRLAQFPEENPNPVLRVALDGTLLYANPPARAMLEAMAATANGELPQPILALVAETVRQKHVVEAELTDSRGRTFWFGAAQPAGEEYVNFYVRDVTERKRREKQIAKLTQLYAVLSRVNETIVRTRDAESLFSEVCRIVVEEVKFPLVWIGEVRDGKVVPAAWCGHAADYLKEIKVNVQGELGQGPTGTCIREKRAAVNDDFASNPAASPWREMAQGYGFRSSASFPIFREGNVVGAFTLYASEPNALDAEQVRLLESLSADLSYALDAFNQEQLRIRTEQALRESEERFRSMFERHNAVMLLVEPETGNIVDANPAAAEYYGYSREQLRTMQIQEINQLSPEEVAAERQKAVTEQRGHFIFPHRLADGRVRWVDVYSSPFETQDKTMLFSVIHDITERKQAEEERETAVGFLRLVNESRTIKEAIRAAITFFQEKSGCEAVGIRLKESDDYPYYETRGFPKEFVLAESSLCARDETGHLMSDSAGYPIMECMCGNVIQGRFDPSKPFFTARGSFWANSTTELLASTAEEDRQARTRNRCNGEGYESVALITLRVGNERLGLLQLNDRRKGRFSPEAIALWERLADYLSVALAKLQAEETLRKSMERLDIISSTASQLLASAEPQKIVEVLCRRVMEHLDCHAFFNFLVDEERNCLRLNAYAGIPEETAREIHFLDFGVAVCGCAARDACRIVAENIPTTPDIRTELVRSFGVKAYACHPLFAQGRVIGTLSFGTKSRLTFTDDELSLMKTVADQVATAMERVRLLQAAEERAEELGQLVEERTTALHLANAYHRSLIETSLDPLVTISPEGMITDVNTATERVTGYSRDALIGTDFSDYFTDPERARTGYRRVFKDGLVRDYELEIRHQDGHITPVLYNASIYRDPAGQVAGALAAARDITEHKQMDEQLRQAHKMEAIGTLAGGIAHDFNNILAIIIGNTELAIDEVSEEMGAHHNLEQIFKAGLRGRNLVRQILTFSRKTEHERKPLPLAPLVKETFDLLRASLPTTIGITLNLKASDDMVLADATQIQQVLMNLCKNAADAMRATGGSLEVSLAETTFTDGTPLPESDMEPGAYVTLTVSDTGHGMNEEVQKKLFEPFFTTKEKGQGTGMGLAVVYGIVKAHHGAITVSSKPGRGSTFTVYLPQYLSDAKPEQKMTKGLTRGGKERILFVDDEEALVELGEYMLQRLGYQVVGKTDSIDALKTFAEHPEAFDLVITDQTMPRMTGVLLAQKLKEVRPGIPVILCTGYSETISPEEAESMGIQAFVMKPLSRDETAETIRRVLGRNKAD